jgi:hypothetical protein
MATVTWNLHVGLLFGLDKRDVVAVVAEPRIFAMSDIAVYHAMGKRIRKLPLSNRERDGVPDQNAPEVW